MRRARSFVAALTLAVLASLASGPERALAANDPGGFVGKGQIVAQTAFGGDSKLTIGGDIAFETRGSLLRLDIVSLAIPGADATISSLLGTQLFPPGGFTIVYDRKMSTYAVWSNAKRSYYSNAGSATPTPRPTTSAAATDSSDIAGAFGFAKSAKDDTAFVANLALAGHGTVNGHPATGFDYLYQRTTKAGEKSDIHGRLQLADDLDAFPVQVTASVKTPTIPESSFRLDLSTLVKQTPNEADFAIPNGYTRAATLGEVIGKTLSPR